MTTSSIVLIVVVAVVAIVLIAVIAWVGVEQPTRPPLAGKNREEAKAKRFRSEAVEAIADETAAKARAAPAKLDAKAAASPRVRNEAAVHRTEAATSAMKLNEVLQRADKMERLGVHETPRTAIRKEFLDSSINRLARQAAT